MRGVNTVSPSTPANEAVTTFDKFVELLREHIGWIASITLHELEGQYVESIGYGLRDQAT